jgi:hypothetical protein
MIPKREVKSQCAACNVSKLDVLWRPCILHAFIQEALACCHYRPLMPQPCQCNGHLLLIAAAHSIGDDIDLVLGPQEVDGRLCNANVALDANEDARERAVGLEVVEGFLDFGSSKSREQVGLVVRCCGVIHHGEQRLVDMALRLDAAGRIQA